MRAQNFIYVKYKDTNGNFHGYILVHKAKRLIIHWWDSQDEHVDIIEDGPNYCKDSYINTIVTHPKNKDIVLWKSFSTLKRALKDEDVFIDAL